MQTWTPLALLLLAPSSGALQEVAAQVPVERVSPAALEDLARDCQRDRAYAVRDAAWRALLVFEPEHLAARRALHYVKRGGQWLRTSEHAARNYDEGAGRLAEQRLRTLLAPYRERILARAAHSTTPLRERAELLVHLLELDPDDEHARARRGEVRVDGAWRLRESRDGARRRGYLTFLGELAQELAPRPQDQPPSAQERALGLGWNAARETSKVRVLGTVGPDEVERTTRLSHAAGHFFEKVLARAQPHRPDLRVYLLSGDAERERLLTASPWLTDEEKALLRRAAGGWLGRGDRLAEWSPDPLRRTDGTLRQTLGTLMMDAFGITGRQGWAWEGVGLVLTEHMVGTRMTWFFGGGAYGRPRTATPLWSRLADPAVDWLTAARDLARRGEAPTLAFLLGRSVNEMSDEDMLWSYALASWLLEGFPHATPTILARVGAGDHPITVFEQELGFALPDLDARLVRWLNERG